MLTKTAMYRTENKDSRPHIPPPLDASCEKFSANEQLPVISYSTTRTPCTEGFRNYSIHERIHCTSQPVDGAVLNLAAVLLIKIYSSVSKKDH
jgi:hypothetical protein